MGFWIAPGLNTSKPQESGTVQLHEDRSSCTWDPSRPRPVYLFIRLFICLQKCNHILYNKPINMSVSLSSVSYFSTLIQGGVPENSDL